MNSGLENIYPAGTVSAKVRFPEFEHLHLYERTHGARYDISRSDVLAYRFSEFRHAFPDIGLDWNDPLGSAELRKKIGRAQGVPADHVLVTSGATEGNYLVNAALVDSGDRVLVDSPMYSPLRDVPKGCTRDVREVPRSCAEGWALRLDDWRRAAGPEARMLVFANLNNPTSSMLDRHSLRELADLASEIGGYLLIDETFRELAGERPPPSAATLGDHCVALSTVTKVYGLGALRLGWIAAHPDLLARFKAVKDYTTVAASGISDVVGRWALSRRASFLHRARRLIAANRKRLLESVDRIEGISGPWPSMGTVCFPHSRIDVGTLADRLLTKYETVIAHGRYFGLVDHFRIGLGRDPAEFSAGLDNLEKALRELA